MQESRTFHGTILLLITLMLSGCGGSSSDTDTVPSSPPSEPSPSVPTADTPTSSEAGESALDDAPKDDVLVLKDHSEPEAGRTTEFSVRQYPAEKIVRVVRQPLLDLPMEYLAFPSDISTREFAPPGQRDELNAKVIKKVLAVANKVTKPLSEKAEFLQEFVDRVPCQHPETKQQVTFKEFLRYYVNHSGYVEDGYFSGSEIDDDPVGVLLRLLMFDKWVLYEVKIIRGDDGGWYSMEDCLKGQFKSRYSHLALDSLKNALQFTGEAKAASPFNVVAKAKAYTAALFNYMNTCLYIVEANRPSLTEHELTAKSYEKIRAVAIKGKIIAHYRKNLKVEVVERFPESSV